jgi:hypothetical protein
MLTSTLKSKFALCIDKTVNEMIRWMDSTELEVQHVGLRLQLV